jgi:hypothetical protein
VLDKCHQIGQLTVNVYSPKGTLMRNNCFSEYAQQLLLRKHVFRLPWEEKAQLRRVIRQAHVVRAFQNYLLKLVVGDMQKDWGMFFRDLKAETKLNVQGLVSAPDLIHFVQHNFLQKLFLYGASGSNSTQAIHGKMPVLRQEPPPPPQGKQPLVRRQSKQEEAFDRGF